MSKLSRILRKQRRIIDNDFSKATIGSYQGLGKNCIVVVDDSGFLYADGSSDTQQKIDAGHYKSLKDFDSYHTADIEFIGDYRGKHIEKYRNRTKINLIRLGKFWRNRISKESPDAEVTIVIHKKNSEWFLDTFNYHAEIEGCVYL